ncbi:MAG: hypothetical protein U5K74_02230 [Gemmatimonadaceae bacterium]|nr:hypothetical protein [Gemmatimonadaceae bacterium]
MSTILKEVLSANESYVQNFGAKGELPLPPGRHFAILTCMDARLDPAKYAGLAEGRCARDPERRRTCLG